MSGFIEKIHAAAIYFAKPTLDVKLPNRDSADVIVVNILNMVYLVAGIAAVIAIIVGGFWYVTSDGDAEKIKRGKNAIIYACVGVVFILLAFGITGFVAERIRV